MSENEEKVTHHFGAAASRESYFFDGFRADTYEALGYLLGQTIVGFSSKRIWTLEGPGVGESNLVKYLPRITGSYCLEITHRDLLPERREELIEALQGKRLLLVDFSDAHLEAYIPTLLELIEPRFELGFGRYQANQATVILYTDLLPGVSGNDIALNKRFTDALVLFSYWPDGWGDKEVFLDVLTLTTPEEGAALASDFEKGIETGDPETMKWLAKTAHEESFLSIAETREYLAFLKRLADGRNVEWASFIETLEDTLVALTPLSAGPSKEAEVYFSKRTPPTKKPYRDRTLSGKARRKARKQGNPAASECSGVYAFSFSNDMVPDENGDILLKVGRSNDVAARLKTHTRRTESAHDLIHLRTYPCDDPVELESKVHNQLKADGRHKRSKNNGTEFFRVSLKELDSIVASFGVKPSYKFKEAAA